MEFRAHESGKPSRRVKNARCSDAPLFLEAADAAPLIELRHLEEFRLLSVCAFPSLSDSRQELSWMKWCADMRSVRCLHLLYTHNQELPRILNVCKAMPNVRELVLWEHPMYVPPGIRCCLAPADAAYIAKTLQLAPHLQQITCFSLDIDVFSSLRVILESHPDRHQIGAERSRTRIQIRRTPVGPGSRGGRPTLHDMRATISRIQG
jgi:hypothetical protein